MVAPMEFCQCCIAQLQRTLLIEGTRQYLHHPPPIISTPSILEEAGEYTLKSFLHAAHQDLCGLEICACQELIIETISAEVIRREFERVVSNFFQLCILLDNRTGAGKYAAEGKLIPPVHRCRDIDRDKYFFSASNALARSFDLLVFDFQHTSIVLFDCVRGTVIHGLALQKAHNERWRILTICFYIYSVSVIANLTQCCSQALFLLRGL